MMKYIKFNRKAFLAATAAGFAGALALGGAAFASGFGLHEGSADSLGNAFAGDPAKAYGASTVWSNPAGMALLGQSQVEGGLSYIAPQLRFSGHASNPLTGGNTSGVAGGNAIAPAADGALYGVWAMAPAWRLGVSVTAPFGERVSYPADFLGRYQSLVSNITDMNLGLALSYAVNDQLSIGGGPDIDYLSARLTQNLNIPTLSALTGQDPLADVHGNSLGIGYNLGALYQIDSATRIGVDYRSRIRHDIHGAQKISTPGDYSLYSPATAALLAAGNTAATTSVTLPDNASIGIYHQINPRWAVMGSVQWTEWSLFNTLNITPTNGTPGTIISERWNNAWYVGVGTNYQATDKLMLQTGFAYDQSPVTASNRTTRVPDADHYDLGFGVQYQILPSTRLDLAYLHVFSPGGGINNSASAAAGTISGNYNVSDDSLTAGMTVKF